MIDTKSPAQKRADRLAADSVGCSVRVHIAPHTFIRGTIHQARFLRFENMLKETRKAVFEIVLHAGTGGEYNHLLTVYQLPRFGAGKTVPIKSAEFQNETIKI